MSQPENERSHIDHLTGLYNQRFFHEVLNREASRAKRHRLPLALLMIDVDDFKRVNEVHGHPAGDYALKTLSDILLSCVRREDFVFRYGGDEFVVVLPHTGGQGGMHVAEHIRNRVESAEIAPTLGLKMSVSIGVAEYEIGKGVESFVKRADQALYRAKRRDDGDDDELGVPAYV